MTNEELLTEIGAKMAAMEGRFDTKMAKMEGRLLDHIQGVGAQLHTQMQEIMDRQDARLDRQGGLIQGGSRAMVRMIKWTESADTTFSRYDRRLTQLEKRLVKIEKRK